MSYLPYRDNPDLASVGEITQQALENLAGHIDASSQRGLHADQCNCELGENCSSYAQSYQGGTEEVLGWLVAEGLLDANAVVKWLAMMKPTRIGIPASEVARFLRKAQRAMQPEVEDRARRGVFAFGDVVAADMGAPLRPIYVPAVVTLIDVEQVLIQGDAGDVYETKLARLRHARVVSDTVCELYGMPGSAEIRDIQAGAETSSAEPLCTCGCPQSAHAGGTHRGVCYTCYGASDHGMKSYCNRYRKPLSASALRELPGGER